MSKLLVALLATLAFSTAAHADNNTDIVNALVSKGVLTEEEGALLTKGRTDEAAGQAKALKKASKLKVSDAIDSATLYGDVRVRHETRKATNQNDIELTRNRERYKITAGVKTEAGAWYSDLAFAMGSEGRSDNATFAGSATNGNAPKETLYVKRAMVGYKATDWLSVEAGRIANPLYTTELVWDRDLTHDGAAARVNYAFGDYKLFGTAEAFQYKGDSKNYANGATVDATTNEVYVGQVGVETEITSQIKAKVAGTYYKYGNVGADFHPGAGTAIVPTGTNVIGTNNLRVVELPSEVSYKFNDKLTAKVYGDYAVNLDADKRANAAGDTTSAANDDTAWLLGASVKSQLGKKEAKGDWEVKGWYQQTGLYSIDPNAVDSDFFDSKINVKGYVLKGQYALADNVFFNGSYGHGSRLNNAMATTGVDGDTKYNFKDFDLVQVDVTYKF
jgi:polyhydroxyalkanoate synthesis regulator phasin